MAMSYSRPDPSSPAEVSAASFGTARRGYEPAEVREFLRMVAAELARLQEREKFLERELRTAQRGSMTPAALTIDDEVVTRMLGEEAARILQTAREAASQIKTRAEDNAARVLREATDEAQRHREEAELDTARRRQDASADAEAEVQMAKQQGREMVNEARAYRERVLGELSRRREMARQQIEQLVHGRDRLLNAFERARIAAVDVMAELTPLGEPGDYVNLAPVTGPVPLILPSAPLAPPSAESEVAAATGDAFGEVDVPADEPAADTAVEETVESLEAPADEEIAADDDVTVADDAIVDDVVAEVDDAPMAPVVALFGADTAADDRAGDDDEQPDEAPTASESRASVDDLFARLRASRIDDVAARVAGDVAESVEQPAPQRDDTTALSVFEPSPEAPPAEAEPDDSPFGRRDAALTPLIVAAARKLKRVLADEQNDALAALRRTQPSTTLVKLLAAPADHGARYSDSVVDELVAAAVAGAASVDGQSVAAHRRLVVKAHATRPAIEALHASLVVPLRDRIERAIDDAAGDNGQLSSAVRAVYREWKSQRIDEHLDDVMLTAFGHGALAALVPGTPVCWAVDPSGPACPDADDNALAGVVAAGEAFPTDHLCAPAHPGCRCMLVPAPR